MSETPRTDEQAIRIMFGNLDTIVPVEFARQLETELADKDKLIDQLKNCYNCKFELHAAKECETCNTADCDDSHHYETSNWQPKEPEAAERGE